MNYKETQNAKWRNQLFRVCLYLVLICFAAEIAIYLIDSSTKELFLPLPLYRLRFIYLPAGLNVVMLLITYFCINSPRLSNRTKNAWAGVMIYFVCANIQVVHYVYGPLLMLPGIAIFVTTLFSDKKLTLSITFASIASLGAAAVLASTELRKDDPQLIADVGIAAIVMLSMYITANLLINYTKQQIDHILEGNERQLQLIEECNMDPLMGIGNRRALQEKFDKIRGTNATDRNPQLLMIDIDDFKHVNDTFGHPCGDEVLIKLARLIKQLVRDSGRNMEAYRFGGEEIALLFWNMSEKAVWEMCNDLREACYRQSFSFDRDLRVSFSGGLARMKPHQTPEDWIADADARLYEAKTSGKNRICRDVQG